MDKEFAKLYKKEEWKEFRKNILEIDDYTCSKCHTCYKDKPYLLHVHHRKYELGKKTWEYNLEDVTTYCRYCHAAEHGYVFDKTGWTYVGVDDLGNLEAKCENCDSPIRYQHTIFHPKYGCWYVGKECAERLTSRGEASAAENREKRRNHSLNKWKDIEGSGESTSRIGKYKIKIEQIIDEYYLSIDNYRMELPFRTLIDAKLYAFDIVEDGAVDTVTKTQYEKLYQQFLSCPIWDEAKESFELFEMNFHHHSFGIKKRRVYSSFYDYDSFKNEKVRFITFIDSVQFKEFGTVQEAQNYLFDLLYNKDKYDKEYRKILKSVKVKITAIEKWNGYLQSDSCYYDENEYNRSYTYRFGEFVFCLRFDFQKTVILYVWHKKHSYPAPHNILENYYTFLAESNNFRELLEIAYDNLVNQKLLLHKIQTDPYISYLRDEWEETKDVLGCIQIKKIYKDVEIDITEKENNKYILDVGDAKGSKLLDSLSIAKIKAYRFINNGDYERYLKRHLLS